MVGEKIRAARSTSPEGILLCSTPAEYPKASSGSTHDDRGSIEECHEDYAAESGGGIAEDSADEDVHVSTQRLMRGKFHSPLQVPHPGLAIVGTKRDRVTVHEQLNLSPQAMLMRFRRYRDGKRGPDRKRSASRAQANQRDAGHPLRKTGSQ